MSKYNSTKFNLILFNLFFFVSCAFSAEKKEETEGKIQAKIYYSEYIVNNKLDVQDESHLLQYLYYHMKAKNAEKIILELFRTFLDKNIVDLDNVKISCLKNAGERGAVYAWFEIMKKNTKTASKNGADFLAKNARNPRLMEKFDTLELLIKHFTRPILYNNNDFKKELYKLLYYSIKAENPELLTINYGDDAGKQLPTPESLDLPLFYWKKHGFENYEGYKNE